MDKAYNNIWILFFTILAVAFLGFFKTYFGLFDTFNQIPFAHHIHTLLFLLWFVLLLMQPYLIKKRKLKLHRLLGKFSYVLMPLIIVSIFSVTKSQYHRELLLLPRSECIANLIIPIPQLILFVALYILAIVHVKNTGYHMRYIIGSTLVLIGPGLGRAFISQMGMTFPQGVQFSFLVTELVLVGLILYDIKKHRQYKPYAILLAVFFLCHLGWFFIPQSLLWQSLCGQFVDLFF